MQQTHIHGLIPGSKRFPWRKNGNALQYSCLWNPMDRGAWCATVHGVAKSLVQMSLACLVCLSIIKCSTLCKVLSPLSSLIKVHKMLGWKMAPQTEAYCRRVLEQSASRVLILMLRTTHQISAMQPPWNYCRELSKSNSSLDWWEEFRIINWETTSSINCQLASLQEPFLDRVWKQR